MRRLLIPIVLVGLSGLGLQSAAQQQQPRDQPRSQQQQADADNRQKAQTFEGKIARADDQLVFWDASSQTPYQLDDQSKVAPYEGKSVKLMATVNQKTNTLHVVDVAPAGK